MPNKEYKVIVLKMLTELERTVDEFNENFNKEIGNLKKRTNQT